jgi:hypothetical protein
MTLDLNDEETRSLLNLLIETIEDDRYPNTRRIRLLQAILRKRGEVGGLPPERYEPHLRRDPHAACRMAPVRRIADLLDLAPEREGSTQSRRSLGSA